MPISNMIERFGQKFTVNREGSEVFSVKAIYNGKENDLSFMPNACVKVGDILSGDFGESYLITKITPLMERGKIHHIEAKCVDQNEIKPQSTQSVFNIGTVNNSVVGNGNVVNVSIDSIKSQIEENGGEDRDALNEIVSLLERISENKEPIKQGMFSKFSGLLEKHSWLSGSVASFILGLLTQCIR